MLLAMKIEKKMLAPSMELPETTAAEMLLSFNQSANYIIISKNTPRKGLERLSMVKAVAPPASLLMVLFKRAARE